MANLTWKPGMELSRRTFQSGPYLVRFDGLVWRAYCNGVVLADDKGRTTSPIVGAVKRTCAEHAAKISREAGIKVA